jgi:hypothetical protein
MSGTSKTPEIPAIELFLWQLCKTSAQEFPDPLRPIRSELVAAFVPRVVRLLVLRHVASDVVRGLEAAVEAIPERRAEMAAETTNVLQTCIHDLVSQIVELDSWIHEPGVNEGECGNWLTSAGYGYEKVKEFLNKAKQYQNGRRPAKRPFTLAALESKTLDSSRTMRQLVLDFCDCKRSAHDELCIDALRKSVAQLKSTLKKYRTIPIPAEIFAPLTNMFLEQLGWKRSS